MAFFQVREYLAGQAISVSNSVQTVLFIKYTLEEMMFFPFESTLKALQMDFFKYYGNQLCLFYD